MRRADLVPPKVRPRIHGLFEARGLGHAEPMRLAVLALLACVVHSVGSAYTFVVRRRGRVVAGILGEASARRTIRLARTQERRIARELDRAGR